MMARELSSCSREEGAQHRQKSDEPAHCIEVRAEIDRRGAFAGLCHFLGGGRLLRQGAVAADRALRRERRAARECLAAAQGAPERGGKRGSCTRLVRAAAAHSNSADDSAVRWIDDWVPAGERREAA